MEYNQLALQLYQLGFFRADMAGQALRCLEMMDFKNKDRVVALIDRGRAREEENARLRQQLMELAQLVDQLQGSDLAGALARELPPEEGGPRPAAPSAPGATAVDNARARAREAVWPG